MSVVRPAELLGSHYYIRTHMNPQFYVLWFYASLLFHVHLSSELFETKIPARQILLYPRTSGFITAINRDSDGLVANWRSI